MCLPTGFFRSYIFIAIIFIAMSFSWRLSEANAFVSLPPSDDTRIQTNNLDRNAGASQFLTLAGDTLFDLQRDLLRFDLSGLPQATSDGVLRLRIAAISSITQVYDGRTAELFKIKTSNVDWIEGDGDKRLAEEGESSWNHRDVPNEWDGGPGMGPNSSGTGMALPEHGFEGIGGSLAPLSTYTHNGGAGTILPGDTWEFTVPMNLINDWINNPSDNAGMLLRDSNEDSLLFDGVVVFASKENENQAGPSLTYSCSTLGSDFDCNGTVDGDDLALWQSGFGVTDFADADGDGFSGGRDFLVWQREFGMSAPISSVNVVPEPAGIVVMLCAILIALMSSRAYWPTCEILA